MQRHKEKIRFPASTFSASLLSASAWPRPAHVASQPPPPPPPPSVGTLRESCAVHTRTLVLAVVHAVLGGVVVFDQTSALGGVRFIRNVLLLFLLLLLLLEGRLGALLWFLAIGQRL